MNGEKDWKKILDSADAIVIGAGSGLSAAAGFTYSGERFEKNFADFIEKYHFTDMYSAGCYPFPTPKSVYANLLKLVEDKDYFVLTTNVDHQFQKTGFDKKRLFYTQGDYGLRQCSKPCHLKTYNNEETVLQMIAQQKDMRIPSDLVPHCPVCGRPMTMNLRADDTFAEDEGWHHAQRRYLAYMQKHSSGEVLFLELGVGFNTPGVIKYPFWEMVHRNPEAVYVCLNQGEAYVPQEIKKQSLCIDEDIAVMLSR